MASSPPAEGTPPPAAFHHIALRVADLEQATAFYSKAFGARPASSPFRRAGAEAVEITGGPAGVAFRMCHLQLAGGPLLELIEFERPRLPSRPRHPSAGNLLHFALRVADVEQTRRRVESAGGRALWPEARQIGATKFHALYLADPDENVIEAIEADPEELLAALAGEAMAEPGTKA